MSELQDYKKYAILYVDDEERSLKMFARAFSEQFRIFTASSAAQGYQVLEEHKDEIGLLMTDQRMPAEKGVWLLERARLLRPRIVRVLATAYSDMEAVIAAVNTGAIYKYVNKPWDPPQLEVTLKRGLEFFIIQQERDQLLKERMTALQHMMIADRVVSLGLLAAGLSHHIRNALVSVKTFVDLVPSKLEGEKLDLANLKDPEFWKEYHLSVVDQIEKINELLKDVWLASERPPFHFTDRVRLDEIIAQVLGSLKPAFEAAKITVHNNIPDTLPPLQVDKSKFVRLFELLLKDELANLPAGCSVTLSAAISPESKPDRRAIQLEIKNDGPSLSAEALRTLFDPFVARHDNPKEHGLRLLACYFIVHHHGGQIEARSAGEKGTIFSLRLLADPNQPPLVENSTEFFRKVSSTESQWEKLIAAADGA